MIQLVDPQDAGLKQSNTLNLPRCSILAAPWSPRCPGSRVPPILRGYTAPRPGCGWGRRPCVFAYHTSQRLTGSLKFLTSATPAFAPSIKHIAGQHILFAFLTKTYLRGANELLDKNHANVKKWDNSGMWERHAEVSPVQSFSPSSGSQPSSRARTTAAS